MAIKFKCAHCGKLTAGGRLPRDGHVKGDGTFRFPRRHKGADGQSCDGNIMEAEWIETARPRQVVPARSIERGIEIRSIWASAPKLGAK